MPLIAGQSLSSFEILGPLGTGAMGEVYRARDTRLEREVAIKVLPEELAADEERLLRFEREAKALASLNHPNVAQVFGIGQAEDTCFMTMELVPGEDLALRLARGPLVVDEALDICRQIAEGVEEAHEAGVMHRDLKPANVVITPEGKVKVLDFGLARPTGPGAGTSSTADDVLTTEKGRLLGTPTYMAPEQARGKPIDKRVDVWAFGCVLFECLTGRRAFAGETLGDVLAAVLEKEPDWSRLPGETPARVRVLLERCLDKHARTRLRDLGEARIALTEGGGIEPAVPAVGPACTRIGPVLVALAAGALAAAGILLALRPEPEPPNPLDGATFVRLTDFAGTEFDADISPHGDFVAYGSDRRGVVDVWVAHVAGGEPLNLTQGQFNIHDDAIRNLGFGRGGADVWIMAGKGERLVAAPKVGGPFESLLEPDVANMDWTRDGSRLVYQTDQQGDPIHVIEEGSPRGEPILVDLPGIHHHFPTWSFDEEWIFHVRGSESTRLMDLWRMRPDGSDAEQLTGEQMYVSYPTPIDANTVLFVAQDAEGAGPWLWSLDLPSGFTRRVTVGMEQYKSLAASEDGRFLVATVANPKAALWRVPIQQELAREEDAGPLPGVPSVRALAPRYGGGELFYLSSRGSGDGLWMLQRDRARPIWDGVEEPLIFRPSISPDGSLVALVRRQGSRMVLSILGVDGRRILCEFDGPIEVRGGSSWSPDGNWIVAGGQDLDGPGLFRFPAAGGSPELIVRGSARDPVWSPDEDLIVYAGEQIGPELPLLAVQSDGTPQELWDEDLRVRVGRERVRFLPGGRSLVYMSGSRFSADFWLLDLDTRQSRPLTELDVLGDIRSFDVTPDGRAIVFDRIQQNSDIMLIELAGRSPAR